MKIAEYTQTENLQEQIEFITLCFIGIYLSVGIFVVFRKTL